MLIYLMNVSILRFIVSGGFDVGVDCFLIYDVGDDILKSIRFSFGRRSVSSLCLVYSICLYV